MYAILYNNLEKIDKTVTGLYVKRRRWKISPIQRKEEWLLSKLEIENEVITEKIVGKHFANNCYSECETSKLYNTRFTGDLKSWTRFWNQFSVKVNGSSISEISKFNYFLELTKGKPREDILGLPHTSDGYMEENGILLETYGKDVKVHKQIIQEIESLQPITDVHKTTSIHEFYNKLFHLSQFSTSTVSHRSVAHAFVS